MKTGQTHENQATAQPLRSGGLVRAFRVEHKGWPDVTGIVRTHSAPRARYLSYRSANDVGYRVKFADLRVKRATKYDDCEALKVGQCYAVDYAEALCANGKIRDGEDGAPHSL